MTVLKGTASRNKLIGSTGNDTIYGFGGNDTLLGGRGADLLIGGDGADILDGGAGNDVLKGESGNDTLKGGTGADRMYGGLGNDKFYVDSTADRVVESKGQGKADTIFSTVTINLASAAFGAGQVENVTLQGSRAINAIGTTGANTLIGNSAVNVISGGGGLDRLSGGGGDDTIIVPNVGFASVAGGAGKDTLKFTGSDLTIDLGKIADNRITGFEVIDIKGSGDNTLRLSLSEAQSLAPAGLLIVEGNSGDMVQLDYRFSNIGTMTVGSETYDAFKADNMTVLIDQSMAEEFYLPALIPLSTLSGADGFRLDGEAANDIAGWAVGSAGDLNGDGFDDFIVGAPLADNGSTNSGSAYIVFGTSAGFASTVDLSDLNGTNGFRIDGIVSNDNVGNSVSCIGDFNGDGLDDLLIGAPYRDVGGESAGGAYVLFGSKSGFASSIDLTAFAPGVGMSINGAFAYDFSGWSTSSAGDVNGDGFEDILISADAADPNALSYAGSAYVIFGAGGGVGTTIDLSALDGPQGFRIDGVSAGDRTSFSVASAGDFNGDGIGDLIIGAPFRDSPVFGVDVGAAYILFGTQNGFQSVIELSALNGSNGFRLNGVASYDDAGFFVASAGDINGDGFDDLIIGAPFANASGKYSGSAYVVFGNEGSFGAAFDLSSLDGKTGFRLTGATYDYAGVSVAAAGDINGDGFGDLIVGAPGANSGAGAAFVVFGSSDGFPSSIDLATLDGENGFRLSGEFAVDNAGISVAAAGDINGDGFDDLIIGAYLSDVAGTNSGAAYVFYGGDFRFEATEIGTTGDDLITGTTLGEILVGAQGADTINGGGGADAIDGGSGNDSIHVSDNQFFRIDGGGGVDTLFFDTASTLDFGNIDGDALTSDRGRIAGIEVLDFSNGGTDTLALSKADVLDINCQVIDALGDAALDNVLVIDGDSGDTLTLSNGWTKTATVASHDVYTTTTGNIQVAIDTDIVVTVS